MRECVYCKCPLPSESALADNIHPRCRNAIMLKYADVMNGNFDSIELAVIDEALDGRYMVDVIKEVLQDAG